MPNVALSLFVLFLRLEVNDVTNEDALVSRWKSYVKIFPIEFNTPLYFSLEEVNALKNTQCFRMEFHFAVDVLTQMVFVIFLFEILEEVINHIKNIVRQYTYIFNLLESTVSIIDNLNRKKNVLNLYLLVLLL